MLKQYDILTKCLIMLNIPLLPQIEKLKLEIQLILMKQLLLMNPVESRISGMAKSEADFEDLYRQIEEICKSGSMFDASLALKALTSHVKRMTEDLKRFLEDETRERFSVERSEAEKPNVWN